MVDTLIQLKNSGVLKNMVQTGLISAKVLTYLEICLWIDARQKATGKSINSLVVDAEVAFKVSRRTIWRSLQLLKDP